MPNHVASVRYVNNLVCRESYVKPKAGPAILVIKPQS